MNKNSRGFAPVLIILILGLIGLIIYAWLASIDLFDPRSKLPRPSPDTLIVSPTPDPTANWKIYINSSIGFSIKYPDTMVVSESTSSDFEPDEIGRFSIATITLPYLPNRNAMSIILSYFNTTYSLPEWYSRNKSKLADPIYNEVALINETIDKVPAITQTRKNTKNKDYSQDYYYEDVFIQHNGKVIEIRAAVISTKEDQNTFDQILSTFQFLD